MSGEVRKLMKSTFSAYSPLPDADLARIWKSGLIVLDANVLLNLYCYSPSTRDDLLESLRSVTERLWLPHQAGAEFYMGRPRVIAEQRMNCKTALEAFKHVLENLYSDTSHPFVTKELRTQLERAHDALQKEVKGAQQALDRMLAKADPILTGVVALFEGRVGAAPTQEELAAFYAEAAIRYKHRIAPGFADRNKPDDRKYGDFVLWKQMIREASVREMPILFVTDDTKDDWWWKAPDRRALPALRVEMEQASGQPFQMYETLVFAREAKKRLKWKVREDTLKEISETAAEARKIVDAYQADLARLRLMNVASTGIGNLPHLVDPNLLGLTRPEIFNTAEAATRYAALTGLGSPHALLFGPLAPTPPASGTTLPAAPTKESSS